MLRSWCHLAGTGSIIAGESGARWVGRQREFTISNGAGVPAPVPHVRRAMPGHRPTAIAHVRPSRPRPGSTTITIDPIVRLRWRPRYPHDPGCSCGQCVQSIPVLWLKNPNTTRQMMRGNLLRRRLNPSTTIPIVTPSLHHGSFTSTCLNHMSGRSEVQ